MPSQFPNLVQKAHQRFSIGEAFRSQTHFRSHHSVLRERANDSKLAQCSFRWKSCSLAESKEFAFVLRGASLRVAFTENIAQPTYMTGYIFSQSGNLAENRYAYQNEDHQYDDLEFERVREDDDRKHNYRKRGNEAPNIVAEEENVQRTVKHQRANAEEKFAEEHAVQRNNVRWSGSKPNSVA